MDRHDLSDATAEDVAKAHLSDLKFASEFGVEWFSYWFDADVGATFCLARAPGPDAMSAAHQRSHGLLPTEIIQVSENDVVSFLGKVHDPADASEQTSAFRVIVFTDLVDSTQLLNELGQSQFMVLLSEHDLILRKALVKFDGHEVKHTGDGIMASFEDVSDALDWAKSVCDTFEHRTEMRIRVGIAAGEPVDHNKDIFGAAVNLANRICAAAGTGQVFVSDLVHSLGEERHFEFDDGQTVTLKGFSEPQTVYRLLIRGD